MKILLEDNLKLKLINEKYIMGLFLLIFWILYLTFDEVKRYFNLEALEKRIIWMVRRCNILEILDESTMCSKNVF